LSILITGGTGSFGRAFTKHLLARNLYSRICIYSRGEHTQADMRRELGDPDQLRWFIGDVRDQARLKRAMAGVRHVVHAAALKRIEVGAYNPIEMCRTNIDGGINVIEAAQDAGVEKVVFLSTDKAVQPVSPYGASKALAESIFLAANATGATRFAVCRYGNIWRSNGSVVPLWEARLKQGETCVPVTDPDCTRFFMLIEEAVALVLKAFAEMRGGEVFIPDLPAYRLGDLALAMGSRIEVRGLPSYEKQHECMVPGETSDKARRMSIEELRAAL
jgi:UDP-N-acetylglucosamine 4,6-dehydratase/5-epimerase